MQSTYKINAAIRSCLDSIPHGGMPLAHLAAFIEQLKSDHILTADEIREVETTVRRILTTLVGDEDHGL